MSQQSWGINILGDEWHLAEMNLLKSTIFNLQAVNAGCSMQSIQQKH